MARIKRDEYEFTQRQRFFLLYSEGLACILEGQLVTKLSRSSHVAAPLVPAFHWINTRFTLRFVFLHERSPTTLNRIANASES
jgi:hypothetical protein